MGTWGKALFALFGFLTVGAALTRLLPNERGAGRAVRLLVSLAVCLLILTPFAGFLRADTSPAWYAEGAATDEAAFAAVFRETVDARAAPTVCEGIAALVCAEFDLPTDAVAVRLTTGEDGGETAVAVRLSGKGLLRDPADVADFLREKLDCEVDVR